MFSLDAIDLQNTNDVLSMFAQEAQLFALVYQPVPI
jgi:hypothetical protein